MTVFNEDYTLLEGVSLISDSRRYDFAHMGNSNDVDSARIIDPVRIPNARMRFDRFCEKQSTLLRRAEPNVFRRPDEVEKIENQTIKCFSNAVSKDFPEAITLDEAKEIASKHGVSDYLNNITSKPLLKRDSPADKYSGGLKMKL